MEEEKKLIFGLFSTAYNIWLRAKSVSLTADRTATAASFLIGPARSAVANQTDLLPSSSVTTSD